MEEKQTDMTPAQSLAQMMEEDMAERRKVLYRHKLPKKHGLLDMLDAMTKAELDDIRYNLNVGGVSSLKKAELIERLAPEIEKFSQLWFPSVLEE